MELDDLKQAWKQENNKQIKTPEIMELIHQKSKGTIASLKNAFRKQMMVVIALMSIVIAIQARNVDSLSSNLLFWTFIGFCMTMIFAFYYNYRYTGRMENMDEKVKDNLEHHVTMLQQRLKWQNIFARIVILLFILLLEIIPLYQNLRMLNKWHALSPVIRFSSYAAYLVLQYFISRAVTQKKFGKHLDRLKGLLKEIN
jgi:uncharacterized integral membrane protein